MECKKYYLGLDIGTDSIGYAVTDQQYSLLKFHGEPMWGVTLFDEAKRSAERRAFRTARRRLDRRQQRVNLLQELFAAEIGKTDERFFIRQKNSMLCREDTEDAGTLFNGVDYSDAQYHKTYPTIHHLICELMESNQPHDTRLVYLACAWLVAHRGHFLNEIDVEHIDELCSFERVYKDFSDCLLAANDNAPLPWESTADTVQLQNALKKKNSIRNKYGEVCTALFGSSKAPKEIDGFPFDLDSLLRMLCGGQVRPDKLFGNEEYSEAESFSLDSDDEKLAQIMTQLGDDAVLIERAKAIFDWALLANSLEGCRSISEAKVRVYEQHKTDLAFLKRFIRRYAPQKFNEIFRDERADNYVAYSYHCKTSKRLQIKKKANKETFSKYLLTIVENIEPEEADVTAWQDMVQRLKLATFLPKQKDTDNRVVPHQLYLWELKQILQHAKKYLPFLSEKDESGLTVSEKIQSVFRFRVPYFVGPLRAQSERAWVRFKTEEPGRILPWNYAETVDEDASEREFIRRMTNKCTYLPDADVLPKDSLLYRRFTVLNEINKLEIDGVAIPVELKQEIYRNLFLVHRKVSRQKLQNYLISTNKMSKEQTLGGIDETIKSDLKPWHDFKNLLQSGALSESDVEKIIERRTYSDDPARFLQWLRKEFPRLPENDITYISHLKYKDFGRLSRKFLTEFCGTQKNSGTGEAFSVMDALWNTNCNLMELLSDRFTFRESIEEHQKEYYAAKSGKLSDRLNEMYLSNAVKRSVIRSLEIVKEITKATGAPPEKIFVEMTRDKDPDQKGKRTKSRKEQILELYGKCRDEDVRLLRAELEAMGDDADNRLQSETLFLYYMQLGKCMYTGQPIDIRKLKDGTYNRDHIYPQAYVKDDSIINNKVLVLSENNGQKKDIYPIDPDIRKNMHGFWSMLHQNGLISEEKYKRLTRSTPFDADEKLGFINRQLTETSQSAKAVATLLKEYYPNAEIVYVKARLTSDFRKEFELFKSRTYNDLHHAKDAYLNIVTGNVYDMKFSKRWFDVNRAYSLKTKTLFTNPLICQGKTVWDGPRMLAAVKKTVSKNNIHLTKYAFCRSGEFFDQTLAKAAAGLVPRKAGLPTEKYGGYQRPTVTFFALTKFKVGKKSDIMVMPVELLHYERFLQGGQAAETYAKEKIGKIFDKTVDEVSFPIGMRILKVNTVLSLDGFRVCITGWTNRNLVVSTFMPFVADGKTETYLKRLEETTKKAKENSHFIYHPEYDKITAEENLALYDLYIKKLRDTIYAKRLNNPLQTLLDGRDAFQKLSPVEQAKALLNIHQVFGRVSGGCDLTLIGGAGHAAATNGLPSKLSLWKKTYQDVRIVDTSAAGLWEKQSDNLLDLL